MANQEALWHLYQLQQLEAKAAALARERAALNNGDGMGREAAARRKHTVAAREALSAAEQAVRKAEQDLAAVEARLQKIEAALYRGLESNPKVLQAYETEQASLRQRKDLLEEQALCCMEERDAAGRAAAGAAKEEAMLQARWQNEVAAREEQVAAIVLQEQALRRQIEALRAAVAPDLLRRYDATRQQRRLLVGRMEQNACSACGMVLPVRIVKECQTKPESECNCPSCNALLLWRTPEG